LLVVYFSVYNSTLKNLANEPATPAELGLALRPRQRAKGLGSHLGYTANLFLRATVAWDSDPVDRMAARNLQGAKPSNIQL